jgi:hypothetical protein
MQCSEPTRRRMTVYGVSSSSGRRPASSPTWRLAAHGLNWCSCPRPWENASEEAGGALCLAAMTVEAPVNRLARAA